MSPVKDFRPLYKKHGLANRRNLRRCESERSRQNIRNGITTQHRDIRKDVEVRKAKYQVPPEHPAERKCPIKPPFVVGAVRHRLYSPPPAPFVKSRKKVSKISPTVKVNKTTKNDSEKNKVLKSHSKIPVYKNVIKQSDVKTPSSTTSQISKKEVTFSSLKFKSPSGVRPIFPEQSQHSKEDVMKFINKKNWFGRPNLSSCTSTPIIVSNSSHKKHVYELSPIAISDIDVTPSVPNREVHTSLEKIMSSKNINLERRAVIDSHTSNKKRIATLTTPSSDTTSIEKPNRKLDFENSTDYSRELLQTPSHRIPSIGLIKCTPKK